MRLGTFEGDGEGKHYFGASGGLALCRCKHRVGQPNCVLGRVVETSYLGALVHYQVEVGEANHRLNVAEMNPHVIKEGQVCLQAAPSDVVLLEK